MVTAARPNSQSPKLPAISGAVVGLKLSIEETRQKINSIHKHLESANEHLNSARAEIWELREHGDWAGLGYKTFTACATACFGKKASMIYKQLRAADVELQLGLGINTVNERTLRPLTNRDYSTDTRLMIYDVAQKLVGGGGKVTSGVIEQVVEGMEDWLRSETTQDPDGNVTPLGARMSADLLARIREKKIAHKEHIRRMDTKRNYILGGRKTDTVVRATINGESKINITLPLEDGNLELEKLTLALRSGKTIYVSLWTEEEI